MAEANFGKACTKFYNQNGINDNTYAYLLDIHEKAKEARHEWSSGESYLLSGANTLHQNGAINDATYQHLKQINKDSNDAKHKW